MTFLKPLSAAIAIGTGGPFGAEGPIIATGGALGSLLGQVLHSHRRRAQDAARRRRRRGHGGDVRQRRCRPCCSRSSCCCSSTARARSSRWRSPRAAATGVRMRLRRRGAGLRHAGPRAADGAARSPSTSCSARVVGVVVGRASRGSSTRSRTRSSSCRSTGCGGRRIGAVAVGVSATSRRARSASATTTSSDMLAGATRRARRCSSLRRARSSSPGPISLGSGTSGGTLAPLFTIGGGLGALLGRGGRGAVPRWLDPRVAALVGMAAMFAGASRALLASIVFAFETTRQPMGLLPLLAGCSAAVPRLAAPDAAHDHDREARPPRRARAGPSTPPTTSTRCWCGTPRARGGDACGGRQTLAEVRRWMAAGAGGAGHQGFPVVDEPGGARRRRDPARSASIPGRRRRDASASLIQRPPVVVFDDSTLREAADHMVRAGVGRLPVVTPRAAAQVVGIIIPQRPAGGPRGSPRRGLVGSDAQAGHTRRLGRGES